jgi:hypothetical protein
MLISPRRAWPPLTIGSRTQGAYHERLLRLSLVWWRRAAEDPWRGAPLLFRDMPTPLARDLPQAWGVRPERLAKFRARFLERGSRVGTGDPAPEAADLPMSKRNKHRADGGCVQVSRQVIGSALPCLADMAALGWPERSLGLIEEMAGDLERIEAGSNGVCTE